MKRSILMVAVLSLATLTIAQPRLQRQQRQQRGGQFLEQRERGPERLMEELALTDAQKTQFETIMVAHQKVMQQKRSQVGVKRAELKAEMITDNPNEKAIDKLTDDLGALQTEMLKARTANQLKLRAILDDKQKLKFDQMKNRGQRMRKRFRG